ncbi:hypothetical protein PMIN04_000139 [Paraphaeosphaeria minitans]
MCQVVYDAGASPYTDSYFKNKKAGTYTQNQFMCKTMKKFYGEYRTIETMY